MIYLFFVAMLLPLSVLLPFWWALVAAMAATAAFAQLWR